MGGEGLWKERDGVSKIFKQALVFPGNGEYTKHMSAGTCIPLNYCVDLRVKATGDYMYITGLHVRAMAIYCL